MNVVTRSSPSGSTDVAADGGGTPLLRVHGLEVAYQGVIQAVRGVSFAVPDGAVVTLLGPNGAGKTTLLRAVTGLLAYHDAEVVRGTIELAGRDVTGAKAPVLVRAGVAQALEGRRIFPGLSVAENIRVGAGGRPSSAAFDRVLDLFPILAERRDQQGGLLSGGEQQMLAMARALVSEPRLLVLDEPSLGLAPKIVDQLADIITTINRQGTTVLLVEQNAAVALDVAHHGYVIENGRGVLEGPADDLRSNPHILELYMGGHEGGNDRGDDRDPDRNRHQPRRRRGRR